MRVPHGVNVSKIKTPRVLAAGIGALLQAVDVLSELGVESARVLVARQQPLARRAQHGYHDAVDRGDLAISHAAAEVSRRLNRTADGAAAWVDRAVARRIAHSMTGYLVDELVPEVIDGVMPKIRADVVPVVIEDLAGDEHVRAMVAQQSQDMLTWSVSELRRASATGDDRIETALHRAHGRHDIRS